MLVRNMFLVVFILATVVVHAKSVQSPDTKVLYYLRDDKLYRLQPPSTEEEMLEHSVSNFELDSNGEPLWMNREARICRSGGELVVLYEPSLSTARFALDHLTNKFYVIDGESQKIDVLQPDGKRAVLFEGSRNTDEHIIHEKPKIIALDSDSGMMFILTDLNGIKTIYRFDMDGTGKRKLAEDVSSDEFSIDARRRKIYWLNHKRRVVECVDFEGTKRETIEGVDDVANQTAIAVLDGEIYWTIHGGLVNICKLRENSCDNNVRHHLKVPSFTHPIKHLKLFYNPVPKDNSSTNACHLDNGGCQHMCLLNSRSGSSCICYVGWESIGKICNPKRPRRQVWNIYMTPQPTLRPQPEMAYNPYSGLPSHTAIIGK